jgi:hypothetical protein
MYLPRYTRMPVSVRQHVTRLSGDLRLRMRAESSANAASIAHGWADRLLNSSSARIRLTHINQANPFRASAAESARVGS